MDEPNASAPIPGMQAINTVNPGLTREGLVMFAFPVSMYPPGGPDDTLPLPRTDPWQTLQWWESPWQARTGIRNLARRPFLRLQRMGQLGPVVPTRVLYPYALSSAQEKRVEQAADVVAAAVRQAHEMYTAARAGGVSDLSRPLLYFYGAMGLAKAATVALFGVEALEEAHGLTTSSENAQWPTLVQWRGSGQFPMLYRASRWDELYHCCSDDGTFSKRFNRENPLQFHVLECVRALHYDWGTLTPTGLPQPHEAIFHTSSYQAMLLPYGGPDHPYMTSQTDPLTTQFVEASRVLVLYMLLYYFSILARYHPAAWQRLLAADHEPEGYVFRVALEQAAQDYLEEMIDLMPYVPPPRTYAPETVSAARPQLADWHQREYAPTYAPTYALQGGRIPMVSLSEWVGTPQDGCAKATKIASAPSSQPSA